MIFFYQMVMFSKQVHVAQVMAIGKIKNQMAKLIFVNTL